MSNTLGSKLIFIISQPRAGSTLLQRILAGHPDIHATAEPWIMLHPIYALKRNGHTSEYDVNLAKDALDDFLSSIEEGDNIYIKSIRKMTLFLYNETLKKSGKIYFLDKTPRYYFIIPELFKVFPKAKFILLIRNPLAVLSSILNTWVKENWEILSNFKHDLLRAPKLIVDGIDFLKTKAITIRYEDLVKEPEYIIKSLCNKMRIKFYNEMLEYGSKPVPKGRMGDQTNIFIHNKPVANFVNNWIHNLTNPNFRYLAEIYLSILGPDLLTRLGYSYNKLVNIIQSIEYKEEEYNEKLIEKIVANLGITYNNLPKLKAQSFPIDKEKSLEIEKINNYEIFPFQKLNYQTETKWSQEVITLVKRAEELIKKGSFTDLIYACDVINDALDIVNDDPILLVILGKIFLQMGKRDDAKNKFMRATKLAPEFVPYLMKQMDIKFEYV